MRRPRADDAALRARQVQRDARARRPEPQPVAEPVEQRQRILDGGDAVEAARQRVVAAAGEAQHRGVAAERGTVRTGQRVALRGRARVPGRGAAAALARRNRGVGAS